MVLLINNDLPRHKTHSNVYQIRNYSIHNFVNTRPYRELQKHFGVVRPGAHKMAAILTLISMQGRREPTLIWGGGGGSIELPEFL